MEMTEAELVRLTQTPEFISSLNGVKRWELLPSLFRMKGKPFSLEGREQFSVLFAEEMTRETIVISGRQCGKSASLSRSEVFDMLSIPEFQLLYVAPLQEQTRRYSDLYINEAIQSCPLAQQLQRKELAGVLSDAKIMKATGHQTFANGSGLQLTYAKTDADRARGIMADRADFDELQDQSGDTIPIIQESLTSSKFGCSRYTGTAKVVENLIEAKWQKSSMCEWVMKCKGCGYHNIPNLDGKVLQMIQADGMHCVHCGKKLNVREGTWIPAYPSRMSSFRGYHIPQVVCPFIVDDPNNWDKLLHKLMNGVLTTFIQENLGISYSVGQRLLTQADIVRQSCLPDTRYLQEHLDRYTYTVAGIDWGGAELQSFTVVTVIGIRPDQRIDVLWYRRFRGFDPDDQLVEIARICRFYGCTLCCADENTLVLTKNELTSPCYKRIIDVTTKDWVWDGVEWVRHNGVRLMKYVKKEDLVGLGSTRVTGDHRIYVDGRTSRRADSLQERERASAMAWRRSSSPVSAWHDVRLLASALGRACARLVRAAVSYAYASQLYHRRGVSLDELANWRKKSDVVVYKGEELHFKDFVRDHTGLSYAHARKLYREGRSLDEIAGARRR